MQRDILFLRVQSLQALLLLIIKYVNIRWDQLDLDHRVRILLRSLEVVG